MVRKSLAVLTVAVAVVTLGGCSRDMRPQQAQPTSAQATQTTPATDFAATLQKRVTADAMMVHLKKLQEIANAHDGNRALGTPGYDASVDYVVNTLRDNGFDVQTPESFEQHRTLLRLFERGDFVGFEKLMTTHITSSGLTYARALQIS